MHIRGFVSTTQKQTPQNHDIQQANPGSKTTAESNNQEAPHPTPTQKMSHTRQLQTQKNTGSNAIQTTREATKKYNTKTGRSQATNKLTQSPNGKIQP